MRWNEFKNKPAVIDVPSRKEKDTLISQTKPRNRAEAVKQLNAKLRLGGAAQAVAVMTHKGNNLKTVYY